MRFRKKPVVIEATQWFENGDHPEDQVGKRVLDEMRLLEKYPHLLDAEQGMIGPITDEIDADDDVHYERLEGAVVRFYRHPEVDGQAHHCDLPDTRRPKCTAIMHDHGWIDTIEGGHTVCPGDWIIKGVQGEFYPCKPDIFAATYEPVEFERPDPQVAALVAGVAALADEVDARCSRSPDRVLTFWNRRLRDLLTPGYAPPGETHRSYYSSPGDHEGSREDCKICPPREAPERPSVEVQLTDDERRALDAADAEHDYPTEADDGLVMRCHCGATPPSHFLGAWVEEAFWLRRHRRAERHAAVERIIAARVAAERTGVRDDA